MADEVFRLSSFVVHNRTSVEPGTPLRGVGPGEQWAYALSFSRQADAPANGPADVVVRTRALEGRIGVGLVAADLSTYFCEREIGVADGLADVRLTVEHLEDVAAVILRNTGREQRPRFEVSSIEVHPLPARPFAIAEPRLRGFQRKSSLDDQRRLLQGEARVIVDVGANIGDTVASYLAAFDTAQVHAFEPHPAVARELATRFATELRVLVRALAVGASPGTAVLHTFSNSAMNSTLAMAEAGRFVDGPVEPLPDVSVERTTLDAYCQSSGVEQIDILKLDTQGAELEVLEGASRLLQAQRVRLLLCEIVFVPVYRGQASYIELARRLDASGYELYDFYDFQYNADGRLKWGDALFVSRGTL